MKKIILILGIILLSGCIGEEAPPEQPPIKPPEVAEPVDDYPKIAVWLAKKDEVIASGKPYDLVMTAWFTPEEASQIRAQNPDVKLLAGLTLNWILDDEGWKTFLETVASHGREEPLELTDEMYLKENGSKCAFGWESEEWNHEEIYSMDPRSPEWKELITSFYKNVLDQPQHDGIIVDMVTNEQWWCPEAIEGHDWSESTRGIMRDVEGLNTEDKLVIFNAGLQFQDIDLYAGHMDGYVLENFLGSWGADYSTGLQAADTGHYIVIYAVDTDDTGVQDMKRMRLGLTLSMLNNNTYFAYDFGPRDHGQAWWYPEYDADMGNPLGDYYYKDGAYWREFEKGVVVSSPNSDVEVVFENEHTDVTTGITSTTFTVEHGDGRIFIISE